MEWLYLNSEINRYSKLHTDTKYGGKNSMAEILTHSEAQDIYKTMKENLVSRDEDIFGLYRDMIKRAVRYANIRAEWNLLPAEERREKDSSRTSAHDAFIASVNIVARTEGEVGKEWRERLSDDRKRIGDFACFIALFEGIQAR